MGAKEVLDQLKAVRHGEGETQVADGDVVKVTKAARTSEAASFLGRINVWVGIPGLLNHRNAQISGSI